MAILMSWTVMIPVNIKQESKIIFLLNLVQKSIETGFFTLYLDFRKRGLSWILLLFSILLCVHYIYRHQSESYVFMHGFSRCLPCRGFFFSEGGGWGGLRDGLHGSHWSAWQLFWRSLAPHLISAVICGKSILSQKFCDSFQFVASDLAVRVSHISSCNGVGSFFCEHGSLTVSLRLMWIMIPCYKFRQNLRCSSVLRCCCARL